jgi:hypothetical protein
MVDDTSPAGVPPDPAGGPATRRRLVALDSEGRPDFHRLSSRMLHGRAGVARTLFVFDLLAVEGLATTTLPYVERRSILEELVSACGSSPPSRTAKPCSRPSGPAALKVLSRNGSVIHRSGDRGWVKTKNRATARFAEEREGVGRRRALPL